MDLEGRDSDVQIQSDTSPNRKKNKTKSKKKKEDPLLLKVIKNLVSVMDNEDEKTVLTNQELLAILREEFKIEIDKKNEFEIEVYVNILKKFLKLWPRWDEFDRLVKNSKMNNKINVDSVLLEEYNSLKSYLMKSIKFTEHEMQSYLIKIESKLKEINTQKTINDQLSQISKGKDVDVTMEITCSRSQLNNLFFNKPHPMLNNTIFNISDGASSSKIYLHSFILKEILNWPTVLLSLNLPDIECTRMNISSVQRTLMNMKLPQNVAERNKSHLLDSADMRYRKCNKVSSYNIDKQKLDIYLSQMNDSIQKSKQFNVENQTYLNTVIEQFQEDIKKGPNVFDSAAEYLFYLHNYKYARYLSKEIPFIEGHGLEDGINPNNFDLQFIEMLTPISQFQINKLTLKEHKKQSKTMSYVNVNELVSIINSNSAWLKVNCLQCKKVFEGVDGLNNVIQHFMQEHQGEPDWECTGCRKKYPMTSLTRARWSHNCTGRNDKR